MKVFAPFLGFHTCAVIVALEVQFIDNIALLPVKEGLSTAGLMHLKCTFLVHIKAGSKTAVLSQKHV